MGRSAACSIRRSGSRTEELSVRVGRSSIEDDLWRALGVLLCYTFGILPSKTISSTHSEVAERHIPFVSAIQDLFHVTFSITNMENSLTPALVSPNVNTPPAATKRNPTNGHITNGAERAGSEPVDPTALSKALKDMEDAGRVRERTPGASPSRKRQRVYGDRSVKVSVVVIVKICGRLK